MDIEQVQPKLDDGGDGISLNNVKELRLGDGSVRIKDGALIVSDETGIDRVIIGRLEDAF